MNVNEFFKGGQRARYTGKTDSQSYPLFMFEAVFLEGRNKGETFWMFTGPRL